MCLKFFNKYNPKKILPYSICSHCCHNSNNIINLKCGHLVCSECLQFIDTLTNEEKDLCIICARDLVRNIIVNKPIRT
jgi:transposase